MYIYVLCNEGWLLLFNLELLIPRGHAVTQVDEALRYKPRGCGFDSNGIVH
jgi:hypothetical protein